MNRVESRDEIARPGIEDARKGKLVGDAEREIEIGPAVSSAEGQGTDLGPRHNSGVVPSQLQHVIAHAIPLLDCEHVPHHAGRGLGPALDFGTLLTLKCGRLSVNEDMRRLGSLVSLTVLGLALGGSECPS